MEPRPDRDDMFVFGLRMLRSKHSVPRGLASLILLCYRRYVPNGTNIFAPCSWPGGEVGTTVPSGH